MSNDAARKRPRIALVCKRTAWQVHVEEGKDERMAELIDANDPTVARVRASHEAHIKTEQEVRAALETLRANVRVISGSVQPFECKDLDLVVTVGGDGTLLSASHHVDNVPILGINSAPAYSVGFFCGAKGGDALNAIRKALNGELRRTSLTRMQVTLNDNRVAARVLNDALFCHASPAATSRYLLRFGKVEEEQKSSGFWIGPAAGSTAAQHSAGGRVLPLTSKHLQLVVREPYTPHGEHYRLRHALIASGTPLVVRSKMHDAKLFLDGPYRCIDIRFGDVVTFSQAPQSLTIVGISAKRKWSAGSPASSLPRDR